MFCCDLHNHLEDLTLVQLRVVDTFHNNGKPQKVIAKVAGCIESWMEGKSVAEHNGDNLDLKGLWNKGGIRLQPDLVLWEQHTDIFMTTAWTEMLLVLINSWTRETSGILYLS